MRGQWKSQTRRLNRHYQSGGADGSWVKLNNVLFIEVPLTEINNIRRGSTWQSVAYLSELHQNCFDVNTTIDTYENGQATTTIVTPNDNVILKELSIDHGEPYSYDILYCNGKCGVQKLLTNSFKPQYKAKFSEHPTIRASLNASNVAFVHRDLNTGELSNRNDFEFIPQHPLELTDAFHTSALNISRHSIFQVRFTSGPVDYTYDPIYHPTMPTNGVICYCLGDSGTPYPGDFLYNGSHSFTCTVDITDFMNITPIYANDMYVYTPDNHKVLISSNPVDFESYYYLYSGQYTSYPTPPYYSMSAMWAIIVLDPNTSGYIDSVMSGSVSHYVTLDNVYERV